MFSAAEQFPAAFLDHDNEFNAAELVRNNMAAQDDQHKVESTTNAPVGQVLQAFRRMRLRAKTASSVRPFPTEEQEDSSRCPWSGGLHDTNK